MSSKGKKVKVIFVTYFVDSYLIVVAGIPATITLTVTFLVTTAPRATTTPDSTIIPGIIVGSKSKIFKHAHFLIMLD